MHVLSRDQQIQIIACLTEGQSIRATERITGIHRDTIMRLGERVGRGCAELHDRMMVGVRTGRLELDEIWGYVGKKQKRVERHEIAHKGDQYTFVALSSSAKAIIAYRTGKRDSENTDLFVQDLRGRIIGAPEISTDGFLPYQNAIRDAFNGRASHGVIVKTYSVTNLAVKDAARRYSPAEVIAVERDVVSGMPTHISTKLRGAPEPDPSHEPKAVRPAHQRLLKKAHQSCRSGQPIRRPLQPLPRPRSSADHASGRARHHGARLDDWRFAGRHAGP
jgi:IS1 family transposase